MSILQKFGFRDSPYERPQDKWVCGRLAEGKPCARGPDARGRCRVTTVCQPHLEGERWHCRRSLVEGGPCEDGPLPDGRCCMALEPCVPKASLRTLRKRTAFWAVSLSIGVVALVLGGGQAQQLMPGPLSAPHASQTECLTCHAGAAAADLGWLHQLVADIGPEDNAKLCLGCHDVGKNPFTAHTQPVEELRRLTALYDAGKRVAKQDSLVHRIALQVPGKDPQTGQATIYCATCHEEHKGTEYDQTVVDNQRCQTCHASQFGTFAASHPEFSSYPFSRRTRIVFNHKSHFGKHFPKSREETVENRFVPSVCADCHEPGVNQRYMEIRPYETMCASCHDGEITGVTRASGPKGISFLSVPGLDVATLGERGIDIGEWPQASEAEITPFMRALLSAEPGGNKLLDDVANLDLLDLTEAGDGDLAKVASLAWSVKKLFARLQDTRLSETLQALPEDANGEEFDRLQMALLVGTISHDVIQSANRDWFPDLVGDLEKHGLGQPTQSFLARTTPPATAEPDEPETPTAAADEAGDDILSDSDDAIMPDTRGSILGETDDSLEGSDTLGEDNDPLTSGDEKDPLTSGDDKDPLVSGDDDDVLSLPAEDKEPGDPLAVGDDTPEQAQSIEQAVAPFDPEAWAEFGGWYRQDYTIRYRPFGHSSRFMRVWIDYAGRGYGTDRETLLKPIFERLADKGAVGRCAKCHSIDDEQGVRHVKWKAFSSRRVTTRFTVFSHDPHIRASGTEGCNLCHRLTTTDSADYLKTYVGFAPEIYDPNFAPIDKAVCSACHTQQAAGETCTQCHSYHATKFSRPLVKTKLP